MITLKNFKSISPPFAAGCSGLFRQGTTGKQRFSHLFLDVSQAQTARWRLRPTSLLFNDYWRVVIHEIE
jgi:hypothetical protein